MPDEHSKEWVDQSLSQVPDLPPEVDEQIKISEPIQNALLVVPKATEDNPIVLKDQNPVANSSNNGTIYYFVIGCLTAITAAVFIIAAILAGMAAKASAVAAVSLAAAATTTLLPAVSLLPAIICPILGVVLFAALIGTICAYCPCSSSSTGYINTNTCVPSTTVTHYPGSFFNTSCPVDYTHHHHGHGGQHHTHVDVGGHYDHGGTHHSHGGSVFHGH